MHENTMGQKTGPGSDMDIDTNERQQQREWVFQRVARVLLTLLLVCIAFGLIGRGGPLSSVEAASENQSFLLRYQRFIRNETNDTLRVSFQARADTVRIRLDNQYVDHIVVEHVMPQPVRVIAHKDAMVYVFHAVSGDRAEVLFHFSPQKVGGLQGWVAVDDSSPLHFSQFVYP